MAAALGSNDMLVMVGWIGLIHFFVEAIIMGTLSGWQLTRPVIEEGLLDSTLLTLLSTPLIYAWVAKPFIHSARDAQSALSQEVRRQSDQATQLETTLASLSCTLGQNEELRAKLRRANEIASDVNERTLQRIGADLHDGPAQLLTYSLLRLGKFDAIIRAAGATEGDGEIEQMRVALADTLTEVRNISRGLSLPQLATATLEETISLAVILHQEQTGTKVEQEKRDLPKHASQAVKVCVYRVVQESLANASRHGQGVELKVSAHVDHQLIVEIEDKGRGFDPKNIDTTGLGITGMRARVEALGGTLKIDSKPECGARLTIKLDVNKNTDGETDNA